MGLKKSNKHVEKISKVTVSEKRGNRCEQYPSISLRYLTTNKNFNFDYFTDENKKKDMCQYLTTRLHEITSNSYMHWLSKGKGCGCETIEYWRLKNVNPNDLIITKDEKVYIFRFYKQKYRIIGTRIDGCPTLYIIGFDFNYSAYDHGN